MMPMASPTPTSTGTASVAASTRGTVRYFIGLVDRVTSASICSVTFIVPISAAIEEATRAATIRPPSTGPKFARHADGDDRGHHGFGVEARAAGIDLQAPARRR